MKKMIVNVYYDDKLASTINLSAEECTKTSVAELTKSIFAEVLPSTKPPIILPALTKVCPSELLSHYVLCFGGGHATILRPRWSERDLPGYVRLPVASKFINVNISLYARRGSGILDPNLPLYFPEEIKERTPGPIDLNLVISAATHEDPPRPRTNRLTDVLYLVEQDNFPGCVRTFKTQEVDGVNDELPELDAYFFRA